MCANIISTLHRLLVLHYFNNILEHHTAQDFMCANDIFTLHRLLVLHYYNEIFYHQSPYNLMYHGPNAGRIFSVINKHT